MHKTILPWLLTITLTICLTAQPASAAQDKAAAAQAKLKAQLAKFGTGPQVKLELALRDGSKLKGYLGQLKEESLVLADAKTGAQTEIAFAEVTEARRRGLTKGAKIALISIGAAVLGVFIFFKTCGNPDVCG